MKWEIKMNKQREMKRDGAGLLFDRMQLLIECYNDPEFKTWCQQNNDSRVDFLNRELEDVGQEFLHMKTLTDRFPNREDWVGTSVRKMTAQVIAEQQDERRKQREAEAVKPKQKTIHFAPRSASQNFLPMQTNPSTPAAGVSKPTVQPASQPTGKAKTTGPNAHYEATIADLRSRLEREREAFQNEISRLQRENARLRKRLESYERKVQLA